MSQQDVYDILKEKKEPVTSLKIWKEITRKGRKVSRGSICTNLSKMVNRSCPSVLRLETSSSNIPKYILIKNAKKEHIEKIPDWIKSQWGIKIEEKIK